MRKVYFDNNATTPLDQSLKAELWSIMDLWGNPSSIHWAGQSVKGVIRKSRQQIAHALSISPLEIIFTSGGSEANSTAIRSIFHEIYEQKKSAEQSLAKQEFITSTVEHPSVKKAFQWIESQGYPVHWIGFDKAGHFDFAKFESVLNEKTALVSVMLVNNETGLINPIQEIARRAKEFGAWVHTDAVQAFSKTPVDIKSLGVHYASFSGHKFYALKGSGFLFAEKGAPLYPLVFGGGQERHRRGGTENSLGIFSMGYMAEKISNSSFFRSQLEKISSLRDHFEKRVLTEIPDVIINHQSSHRVGSTSSVVIRGAEGEALLMALDMKGFAISTGSACSSGSSLPSACLLAYGLTLDEARNTLRVSFGWQNEKDEVDAFVDELKKIVERLRHLQQQQTTLENRESHDKFI